jgi:hypothetical protein
MFGFGNLATNTRFEQHYGAPHDDNPILGYNSDSDDSYTEDELLAYAQSKKKKKKQTNNNQVEY